MPNGVHTDNEHPGHAAVELNTLEGGLNVTNFRFRSQRTLAAPAEVRGVGFLTGADVRLRFRPAPPDTGVLFVRTDLGNFRIPARIEEVTGTRPHDARAGADPNRPCRTRPRRPGRPPR